MQLLRLRRQFPSLKWEVSFKTKITPGVYSYCFQKLNKVECELCIVVQQLLEPYSEDDSVG